MWLWKNRQDIGFTGLAVVAVASLAAAIKLAYDGKNAAATICGVLGLLLLAFLQLSRFKKFKGLGFEAELWEDKQKEAEIILEKTKSLLNILAQTTLTIAPRIGRFDSAFSRKDLISLRDDVSSLLKSADIGTREIDKASREINTTIARDIAYEILAPLSKTTNDAWAKISRQLAEKHTKDGIIVDSARYGEELASARRINDVLFKLSDLDRSNFAKWPSEIRARIRQIPAEFSSEFSSIMPDLEERLLDLDAWTAKREIRRPEVFFADPVH